MYALWARGFHPPTKVRHRERERIGTCAAQHGRVRPLRLRPLRRQSQGKNTRAWAVWATRTGSFTPAQPTVCGSHMLRLPSHASRRGWLLVVAGVAVRGDMRGLFEGLVPAEVIEAYDRLLASNGCAKDQADALVGDADLVAALTSWGMAHIQPHTPVDPAWLRPASPDLALQGVLVGHQNRLARDQELLLDGHRRLADVQASFGAGMNARPSVHLVRVISDRAEISALSASLMNTARKDWMTLENLNTEMPLTEDFAEPPLPVFGGRVRCRSIYEASVMADPVARRIVQSCSEAGEQARLLPEVPMKMKLADHTTAMLPLTPAGTVGALVIRAPVIISALREYFEMLWERATPVQGQRSGVSAGGLTRVQQMVLELMAEGLQDEAIARRLGISVTTVRRHIAELMSRLGVSSRFAAGAAAQRRGWIR
jgi:DNA-binding CsgD family transcriptional regulator